MSGQLIGVPFPGAATLASLVCLWPLKKPPTHG